MWNTPEENAIPKTDEPHELPEEEVADRLVHPLMEIFPEACPQFIREICKGKRHSPAVMDSLIGEILDIDYPKRKKTESPPCRLNDSEQLELMKSILGDADRDDIQMQQEQIADDPHEFPAEEEVDDTLVHPLMEIFPEACPQFIRLICTGKRHSPAVMNSLIGEIMDIDYPKRKKTESPPCRLKDSEQLELMKSILGDADPDDIQMQQEQNADDPHEFPAEEEVDDTLVHPLMEIFPEACPQFIRQICKGKRHSPAVMDSLIGEILDMDYRKCKKTENPPCRLNPSEQLDLMKSILVDADPDYLQMHCDRLIDNPHELKEFVSRALESRNYPTLKEYLRKKQISAQQNQYTKEFSVVKFLEVIPDPFQYFANSKRKIRALDHHSYHYALCYLRNKFTMVNIRSIRKRFNKNKERFLVTCKELEKCPPREEMKEKRGKVMMPSIIQNIPLLQEIAFYDHQEEIRQFLNKRKLQEAMERKQAKVEGLLQACACCYDAEILFKDIVTCEAGCIFCKDCVRKGAEVAFGDGKLNFPCLGDCESHFSLQVLQAVLTPKMFSVIALKKQVLEVKSAGIEDLETCPFCDFATIPAHGDKLFRCLNPECMKESCRMCKEPSHVPLRCDEVEKDAEVKARTYIENKMTEGLLRTCYNCDMKFIKEEGCNKMQCPCGALMCYVCNQPVKGYDHFNGPGGNKTNCCPLFSDTNQLHKDAVLKSAEEAKNDIGISETKKLKIDPTADIQQHYKTNADTVIPADFVDPFLEMNHEDLNLQERALRRFARDKRHLRHRRGRH